MLAWELEVQGRTKKVAEQNLKDEEIRLSMSLSEFNWQTDLSLIRQQQIADWFNALPRDQQRMVRELQENERDDYIDSQNTDL